MKPILVLVLGGALGAAAMVSIDSLSTIGATGALCRLQYGFAAQCDRPFYAVGDTARVFLAHYNLSPTEAFGFSANGSGLGCSFSVAIEDDTGATVYAPVVACPGVIVDRPLPSGGSLRAGASIRLVDDAGIPLPSGAYRFRVTSQFNGPNRTLGDYSMPGGNAESLIPFRIE